MAIPVIYKGDDTDFRGSPGFTLKVVTSSNLNLSGCTVEVEVLGYRKSFPASATGELVCPFAFTAAETQRMPLGIHAATVRVFDSKGRVRTINNSIRVKVTNSVHEAYGNDDPQEVTFAISTVDLKAYAKKEEVTVAIAEAMKDAGASVKLHALAPEVTDTTVTLKPVDGAANWVDGKVECGGISVYTGSFKLASSCFVFDSEGDNYFRCRVEFTEQNAIVDSYSADYQVSEDNIWIHTFRLTTKTDVPIYKVGTDEIVGKFPVMSLVLENEVEGTDTDVDHVVFSSPVFLGSLWWKADFTVDFTGYAVTEEPNGYLDRIFEVGPDGLNITLPTPADHARQFSLTLETDAEEEQDVTWSGGTVIEAFPGASKLVPGLTVWDVAEVAPGKFRVSRASSPAQSAPLTLTAPGGRVAELTVGDDLVLEVKEI